MPDANRPVAIITGAGSGIGLAAARQLAASGYHTVLVGRTESSLRNAADSLSGPATIITADIADQHQARSIVDRVDNELGRIDVIVNNAGYAPLLPIEKTTDDQISRAFAVNAVGPASLIAQAWPVLVRQHQGCIVNVSTMGTGDPFPGFFAYAASKAALNLMAQSCATEGRPHDIRAFAVAPGAVETPMLRGLFSSDDIPTEACLQPADVAEVIVQCIRGDRDDENGGVIWLPSPTPTD